MDSTFWGRKFGVMVWMDARSKVTLLKRYITSEKINYYLEGLNELKDKGYIIKAVVCDGRRGLLQSVKNIPVQMCQFHQVAIVTKYITKKPKQEPAKKLKELMHLLSKTDKESFIGAINDWHIKWKIFLDERSTNTNTGKTFYTHRRLRSAYRSIMTNMPWLFTWYDYPSLAIPNTNNGLEGTFTHLKNKLRNHNGLSMDRRKKFVDEFFKA
jgi:mutator family transposase